MSRSRIVIENNRVAPSLLACIHLQTVTLPWAGGGGGGVGDYSKQLIVAEKCTVESEN